MKNRTKGSLRGIVDGFLSAGGPTRAEPDNELSGFSRAPTGARELSRLRLQQGRDALLVARGAILVQHALLGGAIDLRLELRKELGRLLRLAGLGQRANLLLRGANRADLNAIAGATTHSPTGLLRG